MGVLRNCVYYVLRLPWLQPRGKPGSEEGTESVGFTQVLLRVHGTSSCPTPWQRYRANRTLAAHGGTGNCLRVVPVRSATARLACPSPLDDESNQISRTPRSPLCVFGGASLASMPYVHLRPTPDLFTELAADIHCLALNRSVIPIRAHHKALKLGAQHNGSG